jgi:hypothetical protein
VFEFVSDADGVPLLDANVLAAVYQTHPLLVQAERLCKGWVAKRLRTDSSVIACPELLRLVEHPEDNAVAFHKAVFVEGAVWLSFFVLSLLFIVAPNSVASD